MIPTLLGYRHLYAAFGILSISNLIKPVHSGAEYWEFAELGFLLTVICYRQAN